MNAAFLRFFALLLLFWCLPPVGARSQEIPDAYKMLAGSMKAAPLSGRWDARVGRISGAVSVRTAGGKWRRISEETALSAADSVRTLDGTAEIYLDDKGVVALDRRTELSVDGLAKRSSAFGLKYGAITAKVRGLSDGKMRVRLPTALCVVHGTEFAAEYSRLTKNTGAAVLDEGRMSVKVLDAKGRLLEEYALEKNTELSFTAGQKRIRPAPLSKMRRYRGRMTGVRSALSALGRTWKRGKAGKAPAVKKLRKPDTKKEPAPPDPAEEEFSGPRHVILVPSSGEVAK